MDPRGRTTAKHPAAITVTDDELHKPFQSMGSICLEGEDLVFLQCKQLSRAISFADNVDVFPLTNGKIRFVLTFHGLTKKVNA